MIDGSQFLKELRSRDPHLGLLLEQIIDGVNGIGNHAGIDPLGKTEPPAPLQGINIAAGDSHVHVALTDHSPVRKNVQYFIEWSKDPSFATRHVEHLGASRERVLALPAKDGSGNPQQYYFRAYSQYLGSDPQSEHAVYGGKYTPTAVTLSGASQLDLLSPTGSGTGLPDGSGQAAGLGEVLERPEAGPKIPQAPRASL